MIGKRMTCRHHMCCCLSDGQPSAFMTAIHEDKMCERCFGSVDEFEQWAYETRNGWKHRSQRLIKIGLYAIAFLLMMTPLLVGDLTIQYWMGIILANTMTMWDR
jgi:hypothetical protein